MIKLKGHSVNSGIVRGKCFKLDRNAVFVKGYKIDDTTSEVAKLKAAVKYTSGAVEAFSIGGMAGKINAEMYEAYKLILEDELFIGEAQKIIGEYQVNAEYALKLVRDNIIKNIYASKNAYLREKVSDIENIYQRLQRHMMNVKYEKFDEACEDDIIISKDIINSDIALMVEKGIKGFATENGSKTSHNSIIAKSAGLMAVVGVPNLYDSVKSGDTIILDGFLGKVIINPDEETLLLYEKKRSEYDNFIASLNKSNDYACKTKDAEAISLFANVENNAELTLVDVHGLNGVGLYRTELLFLENENLCEDEQYKIYSLATEQMKGRRLTLRSFDLGGDKMPDALQKHSEENPAMGLRAIRHSLKYQDMFKSQLRAVLRAAFRGDVRLMLPMVSSVDEILSVKEFIEEECASLAEKNIEHKKDIPLGIMVELPSVAFSVEKFAPFVDFFSIGTNDLIQFLLGVDRNNPHVNHLYSPSHPAVISLLTKLCVDLKNSAKPFHICGELAGDYRYMALLLGMGYRAFSMNPRSSYVIRNVVSRLTIKDCEELLAETLAASTIKESEVIIDKFNSEKLVGIII